MPSPFDPHSAWWLTPTLAAALLSTFSNPFLPADTWVTVAAKARPALVRLAVIGTHGEDQGACSGFIINKALRLALTKAHCWDAPNHILVDGAEPKILRDGREVAEDLLLLRLIAAPAGLPLALSDPPAGTPIAADGFPFSLIHPQITVGVVTGAGQEGVPGRLSDITVAPGSSGSPVLNAKGEVVGMVDGAIFRKDAAYTGPVELAVITPASTLRAFVAGYLTSAP